MIVLITTRVHGRLDHAGQYCERHGRERAATYGARWPEPHEHSARSWKPPARHVTYEVRVLRDEGDCDLCSAQTADKINDVFHGRV